MGGLCVSVYKSEISARFSSVSLYLLSKYFEAIFHSLWMSIYSACARMPCRALTLFLYISSVIFHDAVMVHLDGITARSFCVRIELSTQEIAIRALQLIRTQAHFTKQESDAIQEIMRQNGRRHIRIQCRVGRYSMYYSICVV